MSTNRGTCINFVIINHRKKTLLEILTKNSSKKVCVFYEFYQTFEFKTLIKKVEIVLKKFKSIHYKLTILNIITLIKIQYFRRIETQEYYLIFRKLIRIYCVVYARVYLPKSYYVIS